MVTFDVKSLFTQIPLEDALVIIKERLESDDSLEDRTTFSVQKICHLTEMCLKSTYFQYENLIANRRMELRMGSPLSPVVANIFMEDFESTAITTADRQPKVWYHYVDNTFVVWQHGRRHLEEFLTHINGLHGRIQFTMEVEDNNRISFLDVLVERNEHSISTTVYRKPTHTDRYLNYRSHHHLRTKIGIVSFLRRRAENICVDEKTKFEEIKSLEDVFLANGYPLKKIQPALKTKTSTTTKKETDSRSLVPPYIKGLSEKITQVC